MRVDHLRRIAVAKFPWSLMKPASESFTHTDETAFQDRVSVFTFNETKSSGITNSSCNWWVGKIPKMEIADAMKCDVKAKPQTAVQDEKFNWKKEFNCALKSYFGNHSPSWTCLDRRNVLLGQRREKSKMLIWLDWINSNKPRLVYLETQCLNVHRKFAKYGLALGFMWLIKHFSESIVNRLRFVHIEANNQRLMRRLFRKWMMENVHNLRPPTGLFGSGEKKL